MGLEGPGLQAEGQGQQLWLLVTMSLHKDLQDLRHVVPVDAHVSQVIPQGGLGLGRGDMTVRLIMGCEIITELLGTGHTVTWLIMGCEIIRFSDFPHSFLFDLH